MLRLTDTVKRAKSKKTNWEKIAGTHLKHKCRYSGYTVVCHLMKGIHS